MEWECVKYWRIEEDFNAPVYCQIDTEYNKRKDGCGGTRSDFCNPEEYKSNFSVLQR
jgi:hypothetical protein